MRVSQIEKSAPRSLFAVSIIAVAIGGFFCGYIFDHVFSSRKKTLSARTDEARIGIPELVSEIRKELIESDLQRDKDGIPALFIAKSVDLEISFVVKKADSAGSKLSLEVVTLDAKRQISAEETQKMTLHLEVQKPQDIIIPPSKNK
jgi:hypothetical protein